MKQKAIDSILLASAAGILGYLLRDYIQCREDKAVRSAAGESRYERTHPTRRKA
jgi:hypothetical protein